MLRHKKQKCVTGLLIGMAAVVLPFCAAAAPKEEARVNVKHDAKHFKKPEAPPVNIELTSDQSSAFAGETFKIRVKVTPQQTMHADIRCLLPEAIQPVRNPGIQIWPVAKGKQVRRPEPSNGHGRQHLQLYKESVKLWVGLIPAGEVKEFSFLVNAPKKGNYKLIVVVEALAKWGEKEKELVIHVR